MKFASASETMAAPRSRGKYPLDGVQAQICNGKLNEKANISCDFSILAIQRELLLDLLSEGKM